MGRASEKHTHASLRFLHGRDFGIPPAVILSMKDFQVPEDVGDLSALQVQNATRFCASNDLPSLRDDTPAALNDRLDTVGSRLADGEAHALSQQTNFDDMFCLAR